MSPSPSAQRRASVFDLPRCAWACFLMVLIGGRRPSILESDVPAGGGLSGGAYKSIARESYGSCAERRLTLTTFM